MGRESPDKGEAVCPPPPQNLPEQHQHHAEPQLTGRLRYAAGETTVSISRGGSLYRRVEKFLADTPPPHKTLKGGERERVKKD